jgi:hypothetical protein
MIASSIHLESALVLNKSFLKRTKSVRRSVTVKTTMLAAPQLKEAVKGVAIFSSILPVQSVMAMSAVDQGLTEIWQTADIPTPVLYFGFLASSLGFAVATYLALTKIKLI